MGTYNVVGFRSICASCNTERIKWIGRSGSLGVTRYSYPDGYSRHGDESLSRETWRRTWIVTLLGDST